MFAYGSAGVHYYMCYVSALQYVFVRNYVLDCELASGGASNYEDGKLTRIVLHTYPTCMQPVSISWGGQSAGKRGDLNN